jgi:hypothetical protein
MIWFFTRLICYLLAVCKAESLYVLAYEVVGGAAPLCSPLRASFSRAPHLADFQQRPRPRFHFPGSDLCSALASRTAGIFFDQPD